MVKIDIPMPNSCIECPFAYVEYPTDIPGCNIMECLPNCQDFGTRTPLGQKDKNCPLSTTDESNALMQLLRESDRRDEFYKQQSKEQLVVFLHNSDLELNSLRERLFLLGGCSKFGCVDGMDGSCVECSYNDEHLFDRCRRFSKMWREYQADKIAREEHTAEVKNVEITEF